MTDHVTIQCTMTDAEAWSLAQLVKRVGFSDFRSKAQTDDEARTMQSAAIRLPMLCGKPDMRHGEAVHELPH